LVFPEDNTTTKPKRLPQKVRSTKADPNYESETGIYKWVDENGRAVFSDRPTNKNAVAYRPIEIGHISGVNVPRPRRVSAVANSIATSVSAAQPSPRPLPDFKFSNTSAGQKHGYILLSGRISRGYRCKQLRVVATATSDRGGFVRDSDTVSYNGSGSTLYEMKARSRWNGNGRRPQWDAGSVTAVCLD